MIIIFKGKTLDLLHSLEQFSGRDEGATLDYILENFQRMSKKELEGFLSAGTLRPCTSEELKNV